MKVLEDTVIAGERWLTLKSRKFIDTEGREKSWTFVERNGGASAVIIVATTPQDELLIVREYRIPFAGEVYAFPAGLVEPEERVEDAALRELTEETGYVGKVRKVGPPIASSAGLTTETVRMAYVDVGAEPEVATSLEGSEEIEVIRLPCVEFGHFLETCERSGAMLDAKLYVHLERSLSDSRPGSATD